MASCDPCSRPHFEWDKVYVDDDDDDLGPEGVLFFLSLFGEDSRVVAFFN